MGIEFELEQHYCPDVGYLEKLKAQCAEFGWRFDKVERKLHVGLMANFTRRKTPLSPGEVAALQHALESGRYEPDDDCLVESRLLSPDGAITEFGFVSLLETQGLAEQCRMLKLPLRTVTVAKRDRIEADALNFLRMEGFDGTYCEGGAILTVLKALCLDWFASQRPANDTIGFFSSEQIRANACRSYLESILVEHHSAMDEIAEALLSTSDERFLSNFREIYSHEIVRESYPGLSEGNVQSIRFAAGDDGLLCILNALMKNPYLLRKGWPDLTLVQGRQISFVEVKARDKLHRSQLITIPLMRKATGFDFSVMVVARTRESKLADPDNEPF